MPAPAGHHARRTLAVRALAAQVDWLAHGVLHWSGDRIVWRGTDGTETFPLASGLAQAQRIVAKTRQYPIASLAVFTDPHTWRAEMQHRIALAARLRLLRAVPTDTQRPAHQWVALLPAEALCVQGTVPGPPSQALAALCATGGIIKADFEALCAMADDTTLPASAQALAALVLGALTGQRVQNGVTPFPFRPASARMRPIIERGLRCGLPENAPLIAALFAWGGEPMAERGERLCRADGPNSAPKTPSPFPLPLALLRESALKGTGDTENLLGAVELLLSRGTALSRRLTAWRHEITPVGADKKDRAHSAHLRCRTESERLRLSRAESAGRVTGAFESLLRNSDGADCIALTAHILRFGEMLLTLSPASAFVLATLQDALETCLRLPGHLRGDFFALACERSEAIWGLTLAAKRVPLKAAGNALGDLLWNDWRQESGDLRVLLQTTADSELIREAIRLGIYKKTVGLVTKQEADSDHVRLFVRLVRQFRPDPPERNFCPFLSGLRSTLCSFPSGREARDVLQPLLCPLLAAARDPLRRPFARCVLASLLRAVPGSRGDCRAALTRLPAVAAALLRWTEHTSEAARDECSDTLAEIAVWLATHQPNDLSVFFATVLQHTPTVMPKSDESSPRTVSQLGVHLAAALARNSRERFATLLPLTVTQTREDDSYLYQDWLCEGIKLLGRFPGIATPLSERFIAEPKRCLALLRQIGRATHLGIKVLAPLAECDFDSGTTATSEDADWQAILALAPEMAPLAADFWQAQWLRGLSAALPPGIRRHAGEHTRRETELVYLEALCETTTPGTMPGLFARRDCLRSRLQSGSFRSQTTTDEIRDRLRGAASAARLAHAEQQAALIYRERLRQAVGQLPDGFSLTPDIENATLLSFTITENRKLLVKLLRARVRGEADPFASHLANIAFRERLAASGVCVESWLSAASQRVSAGSLTLHLVLETDPLHVLQMGNYFGTCLSAGSGCNAFSTVSNAVEQNKRVLFVRNETGRVIARKLIGITDDGQLVGFETYCRFGEKEGAADVRAAVCDYLRDFADRCRLPLADTGTVPTLFAESWYDDGAVPWTDEPAETA